jgi:hypothetical protein
MDGHYLDLGPLGLDGLQVRLRIVAALAELFVNVDQIEQGACECYGTVKGHYERMLAS